MNNDIKWCIKCTPEIYETLCEWFEEKLNRTPFDPDKQLYWHYPEIRPGICTISKQDDYEEISFEQFCNLANLKQSNRVNEDYEYLTSFLEKIGII